MPPMAKAAPSPAAAACASLERSMRRCACFRTSCQCGTIGLPKNEKAATALPLFLRYFGRKITSDCSLLQIAHGGQIGREPGDAGRAAPVRTRAAGIDRRDVGGSGRIESAGEGVAIALRKVRIGIARIKGEHLVGKADADVPRVVAGIEDTGREVT